METLRSGCEPMISRGKTDTSGECIQTDHAGYGGLRNVCTGKVIGISHAQIVCVETPWSSIG